MSSAPFIEAPGLAALQVEHGFGTRASAQVAIRELHTLHQVHGSRVVSIPPPPRAGEEGDALLALAPGTAVGVWTADCVPILLVAPQPGAVAAVHAGWRGSAAQIAGHAVRALCSSAGCRPEALLAAIGPHIGACCYEVDAPVRDAIRDAEVFQPGRVGHWSLDLGLLNLRQLVAAGLQAARIERVGGCTACEPETYESYRRDAGRGRMLHWVRARSA